MTEAGQPASEAMILLFVLAVLWLTWVYVGYPAVLVVLARLFPVCHRLRTGPLPAVSVLISARNEEKDIGWKVAQTLAWDYPADQLEVLVASDASDDGTDEILRGLKDPRVKFFRMEHRVGKNAALNRLATYARGDLLFFTDANAHIGPRILRAMVRHFTDPRVGCVSGGTSPATDEHNAAIGCGTAAYETYESLILNLEGRIGALLCCDGAIFAIRRELFTPLLPELSDDLELAVRIHARGFWTVFEPAALVQERDTGSPAEEFRRRRRMGGTGILALWLLRRELSGFCWFQFLSHKFLRWLTPIPLAMLLISTAAMAGRPVMAVLLVLELAFCLAALCALVLTLSGRRVHPLLVVPFYVLLGSLGTVVGIVETCLGKRYAVWEVAALSRGHREAGWEPMDAGQK